MVNIEVTTKDKFGCWVSRDDVLSYGVKVVKEGIMVIGIGGSVYVADKFGRGGQYDFDPNYIEVCIFIFSNPCSGEVRSGVDTESTSTTECCVKGVILNGKGGANIVRGQLGFS